MGQSTQRLIRIESRVKDSELMSGRDGRTSD
jgi:hypothetical protein